MLLVRGRHRELSAPLTAAPTCAQCGHPAAAPARSTASRLWRSLHPVAECYHAEYEYSVLRDGWCGCRSEAHQEGRR